MRGRARSQVDGTSTSLLFRAMPETCRKVHASLMTSPFKQPRRYDEPSATTLSPVPEFDWPDHSHRLSFHEAAHVTALYLFHRPIKEAKVRRTRGRTVAAAATDDVFGAAVVLLAGEAFERSIGLAHAGGRSDLDKAELLLKMHVSSGALDEACRVVEEAALALAATERFQALTFALAPVLRERENLGGPEIERILREHDPERRVEAHSQSGPVVAPWYKVVSDNSKQARLLYEGADEVEASRIARLHPHPMKIGSIYS